MKAVRLHRYGENPKVEEVAEPQLSHPLDVIIRIGGAGLCRTDLHIVEGQWEQKSGVTLPYTLGHEKRRMGPCDRGSRGPRRRRRCRYRPSADDLRPLPALPGGRRYALPGVLLPRYLDSGGRWRR